MPSHSALTLRRKAMVALNRAEQFSSGCDEVATPGADMVGSTIFKIRMAAVFETRLHVHLKHAAKQVVGAASMCVIAAFINDTPFVVAHNKQKIVLRLLRNPRRDAGNGRLSIVSCPAVDTDEAEDEPRTETTRYADTDADALTATVRVPGFGNVRISVPRNEEGDVIIDGEVTAERIP